MTLVTERAFYRKTRSNGIIKLVREQYLRHDVPCLAASCSHQCHNNTNDQYTLLRDDADHYIIPDMTIVMRYLEILEQEEITGMILSQTVINSLQQHDKSRLYRKLRQIVDDSRRHSVVFYNEVFTETQVPRLPGEKAAARDWRALCKMAAWYNKHLGSKRIILLSEAQTAPDLGPDLASDFDQQQISIYTMQQYIDEYWSDHALLQNLVHVLADVVLEDDLERIRIRVGGNKSTETAVSGYTEYKSADELEVGIKSSRYISGTLHCRANQRDQAYVRGGDKLGTDILIVGNENRNRAVHGDMVVVELLSANHWAKAANEIGYNGASAEDEYEQLRLARAVDTEKPTGRVVGVLNRNWRSYVATIQEDSAETGGGSFHLAIPLDSVIPKIRIRHQDVKLIQNQRIVVRIDNWPVSSQYPNGHYVRSLGPIHQLDTEISAILVEHGISVSQASQGFSEACLKEMPIDTEQSPWHPQPEEIAQRRDLRNLTIFSIDPPNCQDIDDALSVRELKDGRVELGVHIADVSYFVKERSLTDLEARARGTTVYLADRRFDMLPSVLSERVCSLRGNVDRFAVSVLWTLDRSFNVKDIWFGRTLIRSSCEMEYEQAQQLLDGAPIATGLDKQLSNKLRPSIHKLAEVLRVMRNRRLAKGALELESTEVKFKVTDDHQVTDIIPKDSMEIHGLVAEAMIMANAAVGKRIYEGCCDAAILRRHPPPSKSQFAQIVKAAESKGYTIDFSSNLALAKSLETIVRANRDDPNIARLMKSMATVAMNEASYISSGHYAVDQYYHYGLALDFYTHFTSPIRRYADVLAHRQLLHCCKDYYATSDQVQGSTSFADKQVSDICDNLNLKSRESKFAQRDSTELFQSLYVMQHTTTGPLIENGIICEIQSNGFYVFVPSLGLKGPVYLKDKDGKATVPLSLISSQPSKDEDYIPNADIDVELPVRISVNSADLPRPIVFNLFDHVRVSLKLRKSHAHRHMVYMMLVDLRPTSSPSSSSSQPAMTKLSTNQIMQSIIAGEESQKEQQDASLAPSTRLSSKSKQKGKTMYELLEQFRRLSIIENKD